MIYGLFFVLSNVLVQDPVLRVPIVATFHWLLILTLILLLLKGPPLFGGERIRQGVVAESLLAVPVLFLLFSSLSVPSGLGSAWVLEDTLMAFSVFLLALVITRVRMSPHLFAEFLNASLFAMCISGILSLANQKGWLHITLGEFTAVAIGGLWGGFGQVNNFATALTTLIAFALTTDKCANLRRDKFSSIFFKSVVGLAVLVVVWSGSKIGFLSLCIITAMHWIYVLKTSTCRSEAYNGLGIVVVASIIVGVILSHFSLLTEALPQVRSIESRVATDDFDGGSTGIRIKLILFGLQAWLDAPVTGWGAGQYLYAVQSQLQQTSTSMPYIFDAVYAHNWLINVMVEFGVLGVVCLIVPVITYFGIAFFRLKQFRQRFYLCICLSPIGLHSLTEWPLQSSGVHWLLLFSGLLAVRIAKLPLLESFEEGGHQRVIKPLIVTLSVICLALMTDLFMNKSSYSRQLFSQYHRHQAWSMSPQLIESSLASHWYIGPVINLNAMTMFANYLESSSTEEKLIMLEYISTSLPVWPRRHVYKAASILCADLPQHAGCPVPYEALERLNQ